MRTADRESAEGDATTAPCHGASVSEVCAHARYLRTRHFAALDGLRAVAILLVVAHHVTDRNPVLERDFGVTIFFCISGLVITALLLRERRQTGTIGVTGFYLRRGFRTLPLYYATLAVYVVLVYLLERGTPAASRFFSNLPSFATLTTNWFVHLEARRSIFYFAWSLAAQEQFYLLWPLLVRHARTWWLPPAAMAALFVVGEWGSWAAGAGVLAPEGGAVRALAAIPTPICLGAVAAYALEDERGFEAVRWFAGHSWSPLLGLAALAVPSLVDVGPVAQPLTIVCVLLVIVTCVIRPDNLLRPLLESRAGRHIGKVSFGVYLAHMLALNLSRRLLPGRSNLTLFLAASALSVAAASASHAWFERPIIEAGRRWMSARTA